MLWEAVPRRRPPPGRLAPVLSAVLKRPRREGRGGGAMAERGA